VALTDPYRFGFHLLKKISPLIHDDETYIKWQYYLMMRRWPDLQHPKTFNEKLNWMKLNDRRAEYTAMVDKAEAKSWAAKKVGEEHIIPTLGVWNSFDEIDFNALPNQFVLKTTHDSGSVVIVRDKTKFDRSKARKLLTKSQRHDFYLDCREWPYKNVPHRIIAEQYMEDESGKGLKDYKFFCFNGEPKMLFVATDRSTDVHFDYFDLQFNHLPFAQGHPNAKKPITKPDKFDNMVELARRLSEGLPQVRIDLYNINGKIYFGEFTFFHFSGYMPFYPDEWDEKVGSWWTVPR